MISAPQKLNLSGWDACYADLRRAGLREPAYGGTLRRHAGNPHDFRLERLQFDNSAAALRLWNFLLTENTRLLQARAAGEKIVGTLKDLGTVPVMTYSLSRVRAFYPDVAWWSPGFMEGRDNRSQPAGDPGLDHPFCPVRTLLPAFQNGDHFPRPDFLICSTGAADDNSAAVAQHLENLGQPIFWWNMPRRRAPQLGETSCVLPGNLLAPQIQVESVRAELQRTADVLGQLAGKTVDAPALSAGIRAANQTRRLLTALRNKVYSAPGAPLPALEMLLAEMLAIHFCSNREETIAVLGELLAEAQTRVRHGQYVIPAHAVRVYWVNPVADLRVMNLIEELGGRICGSDFRFAHALDLIPENLPPLEALARTALADPMVGQTTDRAARITRECRASWAEAVVIARIPGATSSAREGEIIRDEIRRTTGLPVMELEIPPLCDAQLPMIGARLEAIFEVARGRRR